MKIEEMIEAEREAMSSQWVTYEQTRDLQKAVHSLFEGPSMIENRVDRVVVTIWRDGEAALLAAGLVQYGDEAHDKLCALVNDVVMDAPSLNCTCAAISQARREGELKP